MCCRYYVDDSTEQEVSLLTENNHYSMRRGDIRPSETATVLTGNDRGLSPDELTWGFPAKEGRNLLINARAETVTERRTFKESVLLRRCVIPAKGFYEWSPKKEKYQFEEPGQTLFMAGCFDVDGHFVVITTAANESVLPVHERMPLLLSEEEVKPWIRETEAMAAILRKVPQKLNRWTPYQQMSLFDQM